MISGTISGTKFLRYRRFFVNFYIEANTSISKVEYSISKQPLILKASISKQPSISGVARFQMISPSLSNSDIEK